MNIAKMWVAKTFSFGHYFCMCIVIGRWKPLMLLSLFSPFLVPTDRLVIWDSAFGTLQSRILVKHDSCSSVELDKFSEQDEVKFLLCLLR